MVELPAGYEQHHGTEITYVVRRGEQPAIQAMGLTTLANLRDRIDSGESQGRGRVAEIFPKLKDRHQPLVLKQVLHGGLYGRLIGGRHLGPERVLRELATTEKARSLGVPVPEIAYLAWTSSRPCWLFLATVRVTASRNLAQLLNQEPRGKMRNHSLGAAARAVREMHDAGLVHSDLNLRNLMVTELTGEPEGFVLDLDRSRFPPEVTDKQRADNLARLLRSLEKDDGLAKQVGTYQRIRFLRDYCGGLNARYVGLKQLVAQRARGFMLHRLAWWLGWK